MSVFAGAGAFPQGAVLAKQHRFIVGVDMAFRFHLFEVLSFGCIPALSTCSIAIKAWTGFIWELEARRYSLVP